VFAPNSKYRAEGVDGFDQAIQLVGKAFNTAYTRSGFICWPTAEARLRTDKLHLPDN
jgi:hypothetical protein